MKGASEEQVSQLSKKIEAETGALKCLRKLLKSDRKSTDFAFADVTYLELAAVLDSAVSFIDVTKFTCGEKFLDDGHSDKN